MRGMVQRKESTKIISEYTRLIHQKNTLSPLGTCHCFRHKDSPINSCGNRMLGIVRQTNQKFKSLHLKSISDTKLNKILLNYTLKFKEANNTDTGNQPKKTTLFFQRHYHQIQKSMGLEYRERNFLKAPIISNTLIKN